MEPVTHFMTGAVLARSGFNRKAAYATLAMTLAAEAPDLDVLWGFKGPVAAFEHHRGWTHTLIGLPFEAAVIVGVIWLGNKWRLRRGPVETKAPVRWGVLYLLSLLALLSHILLDWTNNYGVRPFFPFNPRWYAGSFVFIFEPIIFLLLLSALIAPSLFGLVGSEVGARKQPFRGRGWAIAALTGIVLLWGWRAYERQQAITLTQAADYNGQHPICVWADPYPINPFRWQTITELPMTYQIGKADTRAGTLTVDPQSGIFYKPPTTLATLVAKRSWLGQIYLDWSRFTLVTDTGVNPEGLTVVTFRDLRFVSDTPILGESNRTPLMGDVYINDDRRVDHMEMDGRIQH